MGKDSKPKTAKGAGKGDKGGDKGGAKGGDKGQFIDFSFTFVSNHLSSSSFSAAYFFS